MLSHAQADLEESEKRRADYEAGVFGLPEAMRDVKRLKRELRAAEERQQQGIRKINDLSEQVPTPAAPANDAPSRLHRVSTLRQPSGA